MPVRDGVAPAGINSKPKRLTVTAPTPIGSGRFGSVKCRIPRSRAGWRHLPDSPPEALGAKLRRNRRTEDAPVSVVWSAAADRGACPSEPPPGPCRPPVRGRCRALPGGWPWFRVWARLVGARWSASRREKAQARSGVPPGAAGDTDLRRR